MFTPKERATLEAMRLRNVARRTELDYQPCTAIGRQLKAVRDEADPGFMDRMFREAYAKHRAV